MITLCEIPDGLEAINDVYGCPDKDENFILDSEFFDTKIRIYEIPFPLRLSWKPHVLTKLIQCHCGIGEVFVDALHEIGQYKGVDWLGEKRYDYYGGSFNFRKKRGQGELSIHSWGIAIDINPHIAPHGKKSHQPEFIVKAFNDRGLAWGGNWLVPDGMHFQACHGY